MWEKPVLLCESQPLEVPRQPSEGIAAGGSDFLAAALLLRGRCLCGAGYPQTLGSLPVLNLGTWERALCPQNEEGDKGCLSVFQMLLPFLHRGLYFWRTLSISEPGWKDCWVFIWVVGLWAEVFGGIWVAALPVNQASLVAGVANQTILCS